MVKVKNPDQLNIFDPWDFLTPKRRQMLESGWPGLFRKHILPLIPKRFLLIHFKILLIPMQVAAGTKDKAAGFRSWKRIVMIRTKRNNP